MQGFILRPLLFSCYRLNCEFGSDMIFDDFGDETRTVQNVSNTNDVTELQNNMDNLYDWADTNYMVLNGLKFESNKYGKDIDLKIPFTYTTHGVANP